MKGVYQQADFFLLPTEYEIFGMVLLEAMFFRRVVLTTPNGGADMLLRSGENGIVLENQTRPAGQRPCWTSPPTRRKRPGWSRRPMRRSSMRTHGTPSPTAF